MIKKPGLIYYILNLFPETGKSSLIGSNQGLKHAIFVLILLFSLFSCCAGDEVLKNYPGIYEKTLKNNTAYPPIYIPLNENGINDEVEKVIVRTSSDISCILALKNDTRTEYNTIFALDETLTKMDADLNKYSILSRVYSDKKLREACYNASSRYEGYLKELFHNRALMESIIQTPVNSDYGSRMRDLEIKSFRYYGSDLTPEQYEELNNMSAENELLSREYFDNIGNAVSLSENLYIISRKAKISANISRILGYKDWSSLISDQKGLTERGFNVSSFSDLMRISVTHLIKPVRSELIRLKQVDNPSATDIYDYEIQGLLDRESGNNPEFNAGYEITSVVSGSEVIKRSLNILSYLLGLKTERVTDAEVYDDGVSLYRVSDRNTNKTLGWFYLDLHERAGKTREWMTARLSGGVIEDERYVNTPVYLVSGSLPGKDDVKLKSEDLSRLFHEFGHLFAGILTGSMDYQDPDSGLLVELTETPSYLFEFLLWTPEVLGYCIRPDEYSIRKVPDKVAFELIRAHNPGSSGHRWDLAYQLILALLDSRIATSTGEIRFGEWYEEYYYSVTGVLATDQGGSILMHPHFGDNTYGLYWIYPAGYLSATTLYNHFIQNGIFNRTGWSDYKVNVLKIGNQSPGDKINAGNLSWLFTEELPENDLNPLSSGSKERWELIPDF